MAYDQRTDLLRPVGEMLPSIDNRLFINASVFKRMFTYEDMAVPVQLAEVVPTYHGLSGMVKSYVGTQVFAIRTPQRPVRVLTATTLSGQKLMMPGNWKVASTSMDRMVRESKQVSAYRSYRDFNLSYCQGRNILRQCEQHTSFTADATDASVKAIAVRNPLDRFLAAVYEHDSQDTWSMCNGTLCEENIRDARNTALRLASDFPHRMKDDVYTSQSYFLSASDIDGEPHKWDLVMRLEDFDNGIKQLNRLTGLDLSPTHENESGGGVDPDLVFTTVFKDLATLCAVCKVYAQDFACLDYDFPPNCTQQQCATVGIDLNAFRDM